MSIRRPGTDATIDVPASWAAVLAPVLATPAVDGLRAFLHAEETAGATVLPPKHLWFESLRLTPPERVRAVILGQDPYHGPGQAHGLSFSVPRGISPPPSLRNIFRELQADLGIPPPHHGCLEAWADQGVLLLNASLSVRAHAPGSHAGQGWETITDAVVAHVASGPPTAFLLWGRHAQEKAAHVDPARHFVLRSAHPSPYAAAKGFFGSRPFSRTNAFLKAQERGTIDWRLPS
jgi:uracil-DNA glycosylase